MVLKKSFVVKVLFIGLLISSCSPSESIIQTAIAETQFAEQSLTPENSSTPTETKTPTNTFTPTTTQTSTITLTPTLTLTPTITLSPTITNSPTITPTFTPQPGIGDEFKCGLYFTITVLEPPTFTSVISYGTPDYANGIFLTVKIRFVNETNQAVMIWNDNYKVQGKVDGRILTFPRDDASTGLYLLHNTNGNQNEIPPSLIYDTIVAFDVNPDGENWKLVIQPTSRNKQLCAVIIPLTDN